MKESDLSNPAKQFLLDLGCTEVHGEVADIDLVGKNGNILYAIELKTSLSTKVLEQAYNRKTLVNYVYVAVPHDKCPKHLMMLNEVYRQFLISNGIGLIKLYPEDIKQGRVFSYYEILLQPKLNRQKVSNGSIFKKLNEDTLNALGGATSAERISPFKMMLDEVITMLKSHKEFNSKSYKWATLDELVSWCPRVSKHYANPRSSLRATLSTFTTQVEIKQIDRKNYYRYRGNHNEENRKH